MKVNTGLGMTYLLGHINIEDESKIFELGNRNLNEFDNHSMDSPVNVFSICYIYLIM